MDWEEHDEDEHKERDWEHKEETIENESQRDEEDNPVQDTERFWSSCPLEKEQLI